MKVIFLDIDGVLNTSETFIEQSKNYKQKGTYNVEIDEFRVEYLKQIIEKTDAKIVLSSSWRYFFIKENDIVLPKTQKGLDLYKLLKKYNIEIYDITTKQHMKREEQINLWLRNHDVESFVVIDDCSYDLQSFIGKELIKTSFTKDAEMLIDMDDCIGLCEEHVSQAINILNAKTKIKKL